MSLCRLPRTNNISIKDCYPLPLISESLLRLNGAKIFIRLNLREAYNLIWIKESHEWKFAFNTRYGLYEYSVLPFGLTNAPATFQRFINYTLREDLDEFCFAYLDDILINSSNPLDHQQHVSRILKNLQANNIFVKAEKFEFYVTTTQFLGFIISPEGISMDKVKVQAVKSWEEPEKRPRRILCCLPRRHTDLLKQPTRSPATRVPHPQKATS